MEHDRIEDENIIDRYLAGRLSAEDEARFEEHLFECAACLEEVQRGDELRRGLAAVAVEDAARATVSLGLVAWLRRSRPLRLAGLAGLVLAFVLLPAVVVRQQAELSRLRAAASAVPRFAEPMGDLLVVSLGVVRDADVVEVRHDPGKEAVVLSLELPLANAAHYRVTLKDATGAVLWRGQGLQPNLYDTLLVVLPSSYLVPGTYSMTIEALEATGIEPTGELVFRVLPAK